MIVLKHIRLCLAFLSFSCFLVAPSVSWPDPDCYPIIGCACEKSEFWTWSAWNEFYGLRTKKELYWHDCYRVFDSVRGYCVCYYNTFHCNLTSPETLARWPEYRYKVGSKAYNKFVSVMPDPLFFCQVVCKWPLIGVFPVCTDTCQTIPGQDKETRTKEQIERHLSGEIEIYVEPKSHPCTCYSPWSNNLNKEEWLMLAEYCLPYFEQVRRNSYIHKFIELDKETREAFYLTGAVKPESVHQKDTTDIRIAEICKTNPEFSNFPPNSRFYLKHDIKGLLDQYFLFEKLEWSGLQVPSCKADFMPACVGNQKIRILKDWSDDNHVAMPSKGHTKKSTRSTEFFVRFLYGYPSDKIYIPANPTPDSFNGFWLPNLKVIIILAAQFASQLFVPEPLKTLQENLAVAYAKRHENSHIVTVEIPQVQLDQPQAKTLIRKVVEFIRALTREKLIDCYDKIHLIGILGGAHIAGSIGRTFAQNKTPIARITGLSPSGLGEFKNEGSHIYTDDGILKKTDANFVDVYKTHLETIITFRNKEETPLDELQYKHCVAKEYPTPMAHALILSHRGCFEVENDLFQNFNEYLAISFTFTLPWTGKEMLYGVVAFMSTVFNRNKPTSIMVPKYAHKCKDPDSFMQRTCNPEATIVGESIDIGTEGVFLLDESCEQIWPYEGRNI